VRLDDADRRAGGGRRRVGVPAGLTFCIGLENAFDSALDVIAAAGGTGRAIRVDDPSQAAQELVDALSTSRDAGKLCEFAVPPVGAAHATAQDLSVSVTLSPGAAPQGEPYFPSQAACGGAAGYSVDDPSSPSRVQLCPALCNRVHATSGARVRVTAGCGAGAPDGAAPPIRSRASRRRNESGRPVARSSFTSCQSSSVSLCTSAQPSAAAG
jgi:hypothetical protein